MSDSSRTSVTVCALCSAEFRPDWAQPACRACPLGTGCGFVRCPRCGYENPLTPAWLKRLMQILRNRDPD